MFKISPLKEHYQPFQPILMAAGLRRFGLTLESTPPCSTLNAVVHSYLQITAARPISYAVIPDGTQAIFISPQGSIIGGARSKACDIPITKPGVYFGIRFFPAALSHFFDLNLPNITDRFVDTALLANSGFSEVPRNIYKHEHFSQRAEICQQWLLPHFNPVVVPQFEKALLLIYQSMGNIRIDQLATDIGWSSRHLNRLFQYHTGLSTKTFCQTIRLQHACKQLCETPKNASATALDLGFFDQAHLINDYKKRLLSNPGTFFRRFMSDFSNH